MKILLIYPHFLEQRLHVAEIAAVPLGLYYVGAVLKANGYQVEILNWYNVDRQPQVITATLQTWRPDVIGFSIVHANRWGAIDIARTAKALDPAVKIVFGGIGATFLWELLLAHFPAIDYVVLGEGEWTFLKLIQALAAGDAETIATIKGIALRQGSRPVRTPPAEVIHDLDRLPAPSRFFTFQHIALTRGCPGKCTFCGSPQFWGTKVRFHSPDYFVDQIERLYRRGVTFFYFSDDTFTLRPDLVIAICRKIIAKKLAITWVAISRVNYVDETALGWMRRAGCVQISYGIESGSVAIRRVLNKKTTTAQIKRAFALTTRYGILARAYFIYGSPGESDATIQATIELMHAIKPLSVIFYILDIFPGTALYEDYRERTGVTDAVWLDRIEDIMYFETDRTLSRNQILEFGRTLRNTFHQHLGQYVQAIELVDDEAYFPWHADFFSRLGMTFSHGDYAAVDAIADRRDIATYCYRKALDYYPDHRAYLGLAVALQKQGDPAGSNRLLDKGLAYFAGSEELSICKSINYLNSEAYQDALDLLLPFQESPNALPHIIACYRAMGDADQAARYANRLASLAPNGVQSQP
jgi:radical SAM superfamily enzyme YgiQ (UPF0313 family)